MLHTSTLHQPNSLSSIQLPTCRIEVSIAHSTIRREPEEPMTEQPASSRSIALIAAKAADEKKATDIMIQEVSELTSVADYFVVVTAMNNRQVDAIVEAIETAVREQTDEKPTGREGLDEGTWALLDFGAVVVHVLQPEARDYYRIEELWNDAPIIDLNEAGITDAIYSKRIADLLG